MLIEGYRTEAEITQNLRDCGCDEENTRKFLNLLKSEDGEAALRLLDGKRKELLKELHTAQERIKCLDYLAYQMKQNTTNQKVR